MPSMRPPGRKGLSTNLRHVDHDRASHIVDLVNRMQRSLRLQAREELAPLGVTPSQVRALRVLDRAALPLRMHELARDLGVVPRSATSVVDELEAVDAVRREPDPNDRRATRIVLTSRGREILAHWGKIRQAGIARLLDRLSDDEQEELERLLSRVVDSELGSP